MHRDVKPQNLFVFSAQGQVNAAPPLLNCNTTPYSFMPIPNCHTFQVKLGDLDLGRYFSTSKAQTNSSVGTPFYMSPECMRSEPCDAFFYCGFRVLNL